jgi:hypothetical protein
MVRCLVAIAYSLPSPRKQKIRVLSELSTGDNENGGDVHVHLHSKATGLEICYEWQCAWNVESPQLINHIMSGA